MWAFAAFDERTGTLTLCRDRFGEKPLFLLRDPDGGLYFGSEPKFLFALAGRVPPVNLHHLRRYLVNGYKALYKTADTFFEGLEQLPPGHVLAIAADGGERREAYWRMPAHAPVEMSFDDAAAGARERLIRSVELRLRADVPLAFLMSGGIDSTSLIAIARKELGHDVHAFTAVTTDERYEEADMVAHVVAQLGVDHTSVTLDTAGFLERLRGLVRHHDAPVSTITYYVHWLLMEAIHGAGYKVSISGSAADELYSGYYDHHLLHLREVALDPPTLAAWREHVAPLVRNPYLQDPERFVHDPGFRDHIYLGADEFRGYLTDSFDEGFAEAAFTDDLLRNRMLNELFHEAVPGDPARGRPQRDELLDREPLAVPGPRAVRARADDPDPPPDRRRPRQGRAARRDARDRPRPDPRQPPQGRLQRADPRAAGPDRPGAASPTRRCGSTCGETRSRPCSPAPNCPTRRASCCSTCSTSSSSSKMSRPKGPVKGSDPFTCSLCAGEVVPWHRYTAPPPGETAFDLPDYDRTLLRCGVCGHMVSTVALADLYSGAYMDATYAGDALAATYERVMALPPERSDNTARVERVLAAAGPSGRALDVGAGLGVFPARLRDAGWEVVALDPDRRAVEHLRERVGVEAHPGRLHDRRGRCVRSRDVQQGARARRGPGRDARARLGAAGVRRSARRGGRRRGLPRPRGVLHRAPARVLDGLLVPAGRALRASPCGRPSGCASRLGSTH